MKFITKNGKKIPIGRKHKNSMNAPPFTENSNSDYGSHTTHYPEHTIQTIDPSKLKNWKTKKDRDQIQDDYRKSLVKVVPHETIFEKGKDGQYRTKHSELVLGRTRVMSNDEINRSSN